MIHFAPPGSAARGLLPVGPGGRSLRGLPTARPRLEELISQRFTALAKNSLGDVPGW